MVDLPLSANASKALDLIQIAGDSLAQAIVEDFVIFDLTPAFMKYGTEISTEVIKMLPKQTEAFLQGTASNIEATGVLLEKTGKGVKAAEGILGGI